MCLNLQKLVQGASPGDEPEANDSNGSDSGRSGAGVSYPFCEFLLVAGKFSFFSVLKTISHDELRQPPFGIPGASLLGVAQHNEFNN